MLKGFVDSIKGAVVLFYMDKRMNEKLRKSPSNLDVKKRDSSSSPAKQIKLQWYLNCFKICCQLLLLNFINTKYFQGIKSSEKNYTVLCTERWCLLGEYINF